MPVQMLCPNPACAKSYSVSDELAGRRFKCRGCGAIVGGADQGLRCPYCSWPIPSDPGRPGQTVQCPTCSSRFQMPGQDAGAADTKNGLGGSSVSDMPMHTSQQPELPKQIGPYQIRKSLGSGAFGQVFLAYDPKLDRQIALKVAHPGTLNNAKAAERFLREARAGARLHHTNIVTVFDAGQDGPHHYIASVYVKGWTLQEAMEKGRFEARAAAEVIRILALALAHAHKQGIVHRDVKPANVLMDHSAQLYLTDFGIASLVDASEKLTQTGAVMGTPAYMAPEVGKGTTGKTDSACDQYSLGVMLYELLCNQLPFTGMPGYVIHCHIHEPPKPPRQIVPSIPLELEAICLRAMAKAPADRFADCKAMADALQRWLDAPPVARPAPPEAKEPPPQPEVVFDAELVDFEKGGATARPRSKSRAGTTVHGGAAKKTGVGKTPSNPFDFGEDADRGSNATAGTRKKPANADIIGAILICVGLVGLALASCGAFAWWRSFLG